METIFLIIILILSVIVHEVSHGYAALALGDPTAKHQGRLTLNPVPHLDMWGSIIIPGLLLLTGTNIIFGWAKPVPYNPYNLRNQRWGELLVALAGPVSNILIAIIFGALIRFGVLSPELIAFGVSVVLVNLVLAVFNLVPIPPLDGSKILFAILPPRFYELRARMERFGFVLVLIFIFFFWQVITPVIRFLFSLLTGM